MRSLNALRPLRNYLIKLYRGYLTRVAGYRIDSDATFSLQARFDHRNPSGIVIGSGSYIAFDALILSSEGPEPKYFTTAIGKNCFIGARSLILPGVTIGDGCIIGAGTVVTSNIPPHSIAVGHPAKIIRSDITTGRYGRLDEADDNQSIFTASENSPHFAVESDNG